MNLRQHVRKGAGLGWHVLQTWNLFCGYVQLNVIDGTVTFYTNNWCTACKFWCRDGLKSYLHVLYDMLQKRITNSVVINDCAFMFGTCHTVKFCVSENYAQK